MTSMIENIGKHAMSLQKTHRALRLYIFLLWFLSSSSSSFFFFSSPIFSANGYWMSTITSTHGVASANLECRSEMCCTRQKLRKKSPSAHHRTNLSGYYIFVTKARINNRKKFVKQQYLLHMCSQYGERWPTNG